MTQLAQVIPFPRRNAWEPWCSKQDVADHFRRSTRWVELMIRDHALPSHPPAPGSNRRRFRLSEVDQWAEGRT